MDWIEYVSSHSGSPFSPKMRHHNMKDFSPEAFFIGARSAARKTQSTLMDWIRETEKQISLNESMRLRKINELLVTAKR